MKRARSCWLAAVLLTLMPSIASAGERADTTLTLGDRPTIVAFFGLPLAVADADPEVGQVLADLHYFLRDARAPLEQLGFDVLEAYDTSIHLSAAGREWDLAMKPGLPVGYYLWSPAGPAYLCRGVRRANDLVAITNVYLDEAQRGAASRLAQCERQDR